MKIYLAARFSRAEELRGYRDQLQAQGHEVTSRWINEGAHKMPDRDVSEEEQMELRQKFAEEDYTDLIGADMVISFTEARGTAVRAGGRHVEFGVALATPDKSLIVIGHRENIFHYLPEVLFCKTWEEFMLGGWTTRTR